MRQVASTLAEPALLLTPWRHGDGERGLKYAVLRMQNSWLLQRGAPRLVETDAPPRQRPEDLLVLKTIEGIGGAAYNGV